MDFTVPINEMNYPGAWLIKPPLSRLYSKMCPWSSSLFTSPTSTTCSSPWSCSVTTSKPHTLLLETTWASLSSGKHPTKPHDKSLILRPVSDLLEWKHWWNHHSMCRKCSAGTIWSVSLFSALSFVNLADSSYDGKWRRRLMGRKTSCTDRSYKQ